MKIMIGPLGCAALAAATLLLPRAEAQEVLHAPDAIRACLCEEQAVAAMAAALRQDTESYDARRQELQALEERVAAARTQLDPTDFAGREQLGRLLDERDAVRNRFAAEVTPHHNDVVARYNAVAEAFTQQCTGRDYDADVLARVKVTLSCPEMAVEPGK